MAYTWRGKGRSFKRQAKFIAPHDFMFGGKLIPKGSEVKQCETENFGWTFWKESPDQKNWHIAKE